MDSLCSNGPHIWLVRRSYWPEALECAVPWAVGLVEQEYLQGQEWVKVAEMEMAMVERDSDS